MPSRNPAGGLRVPAPGGYEREASKLLGVGVWHWPAVEKRFFGEGLYIILRPVINRDPLEVWLENVKA